MSLKVVVVTLISMLFLQTVRSQTDELLVLGQTGSLHLRHTVVAKENWYSIGRLYNLSPKELAPYNKLDLGKPLSIGQELDIPLTATNFSQNGLKAAGETLVPLYHVVQEKEWMYRISVNHNKVPIGSLEKWNNMNKDQVKAGMHLVVGYLKVKTALSALATRGNGAAGTAVTAVEKPAVSAPGAVPGAGKEKPAVTSVVDTVSRATAKTEGPAKSGGAIPSKTEGTAPGGTGAASGATGATSGGTGGASGGTSATSSGTGVAPGGVGTTHSGTGANGGVSTPAGGKSFNGGFFKSDYSDGGKSVSGVAGIFKSTSGWQDGKYYALMNNIPVGTIVRITSGTSGKSIYAKVLGQLPDMKESAGLTVRISNAAAGELEEGDGKFNVDIRY